MPCACSQQLILPPYQRRGYGLLLYKTVAAHLRSLSRAVDFTVEAPNEAFTRIRDRADCAACMQLPYVQALNFDTADVQAFVKHVRVSHFASTCVCV